ncbi:MAG: ATP-binding protein, partial [Chthoniobacteraceae bacterium]
FVAVNNAATRHYGYGQSEFLMLSLPAITRDADPLDIERAFRSSATSFDAGEWKHKKRNGEVIEVQLTAHAISFAGKIAKIVLANDVTERNRAQRQLEEMHRQLVDASRAAGMAEVATGVLHNVGNVLNSVNVSSNVLADSVRKSKTASIRKVADLLDANKADLAAFFGPDGKGQMIPGYLTTLAQQMDAEQQSRLTEIEQLTKNIAHIKDIVAMQQDYAKSTGVMEDFAPRALIDEALKMAGPELQRRSVNVSLDCRETLPKVSTDRHKVLQILINLITNAQQAMEGKPETDRTLTITASCAGDAKAAIAIQDNGCGIAKENLARVFNHGFTTKSTGHGFGLHSAANAATEVGGSLTGASEGPGLGATFILELPLAEPAAAKKAA